MRRVVPALWLALLLCLGIRSIVRDDVRYGWGMFPYVLRYTVDYRWRLADDTTLPFEPGREIRRVKKVFRPRREHEHGYGLGALRTELEAYADLVVKTKPRPASARAFEIELRARKHEDAEVIEVITR